MCVKLESIVQQLPALHVPFALRVKHQILPAQKAILANYVPQVQLQLQVIRHVRNVPLESLRRMPLLVMLKLTEHHVPIVLLELILLLGRLIVSHALMVLLVQRVLVLVQHAPLAK